MNRQKRNILIIAGGALVVLLLACLAVTYAAYRFLPWEQFLAANTTPRPSGTVVVIAPPGTPSATSRPAGAPAPATVVPRTPVAPGTSVPAPTTGQATPAPDTEALLEQADMPARDLRDLALRLKPAITDIPATVNPTPPNYKVNDQLQFWVENSDTQEHRQITATLRVKTDHVYMWVENGVNVSAPGLQTSARRFETKTYPTDREFFGSEWTPGVDNDPHISILHARGLGKNIAGYYSSADEFSRLINPYSNQKEMIYISAEDDSARPNTSFYDGVLAHEFQHMIHWANDRNEDSWVNEGMSELASHLNGFDVGGADVAYAQDPDTQLTTWSDPSQQGNAEHYGASYLFMDYFLSRFGEQLTKAVVSSPENGIAGFNDALQKSGRTERFNEIYADWLIANYLNRPDADPHKRFGYDDITPPKPALVQTVDKFPASANSKINQYGAQYIGIKGRGTLDIEFQGQTTVGLVGTDPRGQYAWWSNRGDDSDSTLTRAFDLHGLNSATLTFSTWYNIEDGWDYAYAEVSTDGGKHWQVLTGKYTTDKNPVGNAFGPGWTGVSGGGKTPQWMDERVDLSKFVGHEILLRFEYVTDDAVNGPGFLVDDIAIPELKFSDGGEKGLNGWQAAGWVLTDNTLAEHWLVQLVWAGPDGVKIQPMEVDASGQGKLTLQNAEQLADAVLIVSPYAPVTTERTSYKYTITTR